MKKSHAWFAVLAAAPFAGCAPEVGPAGAVPEARGGLALTVDILADTDIAGVAYSATAVDCTTGAPLTPERILRTRRDLEDLLIPGANGAFAGNPLHAESAHLFADAFLWLAAGCYDVLAQPVDADGAASLDCAPARRRNVPVVGGQTTEVLLISQCRGPARGGLDVVTVINHPPQIDDVNYAPSKFTCEATTTICATITDPDQDPIAVQWTPGAGMRVVAQTTEPVEGGLRACATVEVAAPGQYQLDLVAFDLAHDERGRLVPIERLLDAQGDPAESRAAISLPVHVMSAEACIGQCACPEGFELNAAGDACERETVEGAQFNGVELAVCRGDQERNYGAFGARLPEGGVIVNDPFFGGSGVVPAGVEPTRLNTVGVWGCERSADGHSLPIRQWIGFSACLNVEADGEYVLGVAGDNDVELRVDGVTVFGPFGNANQANFRFWYLQPVVLTPGPHIIELLGWNQGAAAAFGAEIYGPFPAGSTVDDDALRRLDYAGNVLWSTAEQVDGVFDLGQTSGWSCPEGMAFGRCGGEPTCRRLEVQACEGPGGGLGGAGEENLPPAEPINPRG